MTHPAYSKRINEIHRLLGRYEEKLELLRSIIESHTNAKIQSIYFNESDMKLIFQILNIPIKPPTMSELRATLEESLPATLEEPEESNPW